MSKYGDDYTCTCEMQLVSCRNDLHGARCELWQDQSFIDGLDEWDGDLGTLVLALSPWHNAEEWVWNGDTPVVRKATTERTFDEKMAEVIDAWEGGAPEAATLISICEQEALDALCDGNTQDEYGMVCLEDGSYADFDMRVTYRKIQTSTGAQWHEIMWDGNGEPTDVSALVQETDIGEPGWSACTCTPSKKFYCQIHNCQRDKETDQWRYWAGHTTTTNTHTGSYWGRCDHCFDTFELPGAQHENIKISAKRTHTATTTPDFGLYAYGGWNPDCVATWIPWQDYGLPTCSYETAAQAIVDVWDKACDGKVVEVGCMGGHGRTGTILACLAILSDNEMSASAAIHHVRKVHCDEAIETNQQEWFIEWFRCWFLGETCRPAPATYVSKHSANWANASVAATKVKNNEPTLPLAQSPSDGATGNKWVWCSGCKRTVSQVHNHDCPFNTESVKAEAEAQVLRFAPELMAGETANARRRNAKRANRRAARRARAAQKMPQEYV